MEPRKEELQRLYIEGENNRRQMESILTQIQVLEAAINEAESAISVLNSLREAKAGNEILVPIGSGSFIRGELTDRENVIIGIGAGISVERKVNEAKKILEEREKGMKDALEKLRNSSTEMNKKLMEINSRSERIIREIKGGVQG